MTISSFHFNGYSDYSFPKNKKIMCMRLPFISLGSRGGNEPSQVLLGLSSA